MNQTKEVNWVEPALRTLKKDKNQYCRELALFTLSKAEPTPQVLDAVRKIVRKDEDVVVQARASIALAGLVKAAGGQREVLEPAIAELVTLFRSYGTGTQRADKEWGWREVGNALRSLGRPGEAALEQIMQEHEQDQQLADLAWRVLYLPPDFVQVTEEQYREGHAKHPFMKFEVIERN